MTTNNFTARFLKTSLLMASSLLTGMALANSPVGQWHTSDEKTGELKSVVIIVEQQGVMKGRVEKVLRKDADPAALRFTPIENGAKLEVRGSFGPIGRTQTWVRVP